MPITKTWKIDFSLMHTYTVRTHFVWQYSIVIIYKVHSIEFITLNIAYSLFMLIRIVVSCCDDNIKVYNRKKGQKQQQNIFEENEQVAVSNNNDRYHQNSGKKRQL